MALANDLDAIYQRHRQELFSYALAIAKCSAGAEDAIHTAFVRTLTLKQAPQDLKAYIFRAVHNAAIDCRRMARRAEAASGSDFDSCIYDLHLSNLEDSETLQAVAKAVQALPDEEQEVIIAHLHANLTFREIADISGRSVGTVASWYRRGLERLRKEIEVTDG